MIVFSTNLYYLDYWLDTSFASDVDIIFKTSIDDANRLKKYVEFGMDINAADKDGITALHLASFFGNKKSAENLINNNIDINKTENKGLTALDIALLGKHSEFSLYLQNKGAYKSKLSCCIIEHSPYLKKCEQFLFKQQSEVVNAAGVNN